MVVIDDTNWKLDAQGLPGVQLSLHLLLRVVADVGIVGFPNAGVCNNLNSKPYPLLPSLGLFCTNVGPHQAM